MVLIMIKNKVIAVEFDGTITFPSKYPITGEPNIDVINKLKTLHKYNTLILYTCREGVELQEAIDMCASYELMFDYINENIESRHSRKIWADIYLDDKSTTDINVLFMRG